MYRISPRSGRRARALPRIALLAGIVLLAAPTGAENLAARTPPPRDSLGERLARALDVRALRRARISAYVVRARDGQVLFERSADRPLTPASNMKILTAMASLQTFGPAHRFETPIFTDALPDEGGGVGKLYVRGGGDPVLNSEDWWRLAADLRNEGLRRVRGDLVLDDHFFDAVRWHPDWGRTSSRAYHAPVGGLTANYGSFAVSVRPGQAAGDPVSVTVDPPVPYLSVANRARTGYVGQRSSLVVDRAPAGSGEVVEVDGVVAAGADARTYYRSVLDPTRYAGAVLRMQLRAVGIEVDGEIVSGSVPDTAVPLYVFKGRPVGEIVRLFVKFSNNAVAESLVKAMGARATGAPGSWKNGIPAYRAALEALGLDLDGLQIVDGSGLSYRDKLTPRALVDALRIARGSFRIGPELASALPIANRDGTLEKRVDEAPGLARAKTGLLSRVTSLSGFAELSDGETAVFSVLTNGYRGTDEEAMEALDHFVAVLAGS
ncbi:MAG: D-alanyl-D-alanine carboxypeptidase/D-alanyl-D-alanine-endopeptidase [Myxococcota bacterium]|nr:D-alanyl-D-alanine carboxypeptidase/D-alanyl-D-alanine-endopeptidase [Myxococcota bacterium]